MNAALQRTKTNVNRMLQLISPLKKRKDKLAAKVRSASRRARDRARAPAKPEEGAETAERV